MNQKSLFSFFTTEQGAMNSTLMESNLLEAILLEPLGWTLVHSVWQLGLIAILYHVVRSLVTLVQNGKRSQSQNSKISYGLACFCLVAMIAVPVVTFVLLAANAKSHPNLVSHVSVAAPDSDIPINESISGTSDLVEVPDPFDVSYSAAHSNSSQILSRDEVAPSDNSSPAIANQSVSSTRRLLNINFVWIVSGWFAGVLLFSLRPLLGVFNAWRLSKRGHVDLPKAVYVAAQRVAQRMGITQSIRFVGSALVEVPTVVGYFKPVVLIPASALTGLTTEQLNQILAHEIAHIRRHDYLINLLQTLIETLLFYHPAVWWVSNQIRSERENCCDDIAVSSFGDSQSLARALMQLEQTRTVAPPALAANGGSLVRRVRRLLGRPVSNRRANVGGACASGLIVAATIATAVIAFNSPTSSANEERLPTEAIIRAVGQDPETALMPTTSESNSSEQPQFDATLADSVENGDTEITNSGDVLATVNGQEITKQPIVESCLKFHGAKVLSNLINQNLVQDAASKEGIRVSLSKLEERIKSQSKKFGMTPKKYIETICTKRSLTELQLNEMITTSVSLQLLLEKVYGVENIEIGSVSSQRMVARLLADAQQQGEVQVLFGDAELRKQHPGVAAIVNGKSITIGTLSDQCFQQYGTKLLDMAITKLIIQQALDEKGLIVTEQDIKEELVRQARGLNPVAPDHDPSNIQPWLGSNTSGPVPWSGMQSGTREDSNVELDFEKNIWPNVAMRKLADPVEIRTDEEIWEIREVIESNFGPRAKVLAIVCDNERQAQYVWKLASAQPTSESFGKLANQYSVDPASKNNFGEVPPIQKQGGRPELERVAFNLKPNEVSSIVQIEKQWIIMYGLGQSKPIRQPGDHIELTAQFLESKTQAAMVTKFQELRDAAIVRKTDDVMIKATQQPENVAKTKIEEKKAPQPRLTTCTYAVADLVVPSPFMPVSSLRGKGNKSKVDVQPLIELIQNTVQPDSWYTSGTDRLGTMSFYESKLCLIISQTNAAHDEIQDLLKKLRQLNDVAIDLRGFLVVITDKDLKSSLRQDIPKTPEPISQIEAELLHGLAFVNDAVLSVEFEPVSLLNGQETTLQIPKIEGITTDGINVSTVSSADRKSVQSVFGLPDLKGDEYNSVVVEKTENGQCMTVDISEILPAEKSGHRAILVFRPYVLDLKND